MSQKFRNVDISLLGHQILKSVFIPLVEIRTRNFEHKKEKREETNEEEKRRKEKSGRGPIETMAYK
jgi:hypothetical protein